METVATKPKPSKPPEEKRVAIPAPNIRLAVFRIVGTAPYVQHRFTAKAMAQMMVKMTTGAAKTEGTKKPAKPPRDFDQDFRDAMHVSVDGHHGIPASAFRQGMISACRLVDFKMTLAKLSVFVLADGFDAVDGLPLVYIEGTPERSDMAAYNDNGAADIRIRPMWRDWAATVRVEFDADQFTMADVGNLMRRVGRQVGIGEGRPDSRRSAGLGWGTFDLAAPKEGA